jgi:hypothetical protein
VIWGLPMLLSVPVSRMSPKKVPSCIGKFTRSTPQPMAESFESSQSGTWTPEVLTWAIMQAERPSMHWELLAMPPFFQDGQRPMPPAKV